jgi:hypothetical protein
MTDHDHMCQWVGPHSDIAKRVADTFKLHKAAQSIEKPHGWFAVALSDGSSDYTLYDSKSDAIRHQKHNEMYYAYICIRPHTMTVCEAEVYMSMQRRLYDSGIKMVDPDKPMEVIARASREDQFSLVRSIANGGKTKPRNLIIGR